MKTLILSFIALLAVCSNFAYAQTQSAYCKGVTDDSFEILNGQSKTLTSLAPGYWEIVSGSSNVSCSGCYQNNVSSITITGIGNGSASVKFTASDMSCCVVKPCNCLGCLEIIPSSGWQTCYPDWPDGKFEIVFCGSGNNSLASWLSSNGLSQYSSTNWTFTGSMGSGRNCSSQSQSGSGSSVQSPKLTACYAGGVSLGATLTLRDAPGNVVGTVYVSGSYSIPDCGSGGRIAANNSVHSKNNAVIQPNLTHSSLNEHRVEAPIYTRPSQVYKMKLPIQKNEVIELTLQPHHKKTGRLLNSILPFVAFNIALSNNSSTRTSNSETQQVIPNASVITAGTAVTLFPATFETIDRSKVSYVDVSVYDNDYNLIRSYRQLLNRRHSTNIKIQNTSDGYVTLSLHNNSKAAPIIKRLTRNIR